MRALYVGASGMAAQQTKIDTVANNMANVGTTGFKKSTAAFEDLLYQEVTSGGKGETTNGAEVGGGVRLTSLDRDHSSGTFVETGDAFHVAIKGEEYLVLEGTDGTPAYTRDGTLALDGDGTLMTASGLRVAGKINIPRDVVSVTITEDGTVSGRFNGDVDETVFGQLELAGFINPTGLRSLGGNTYAETPASGQPQLGTPGESSQIVQGYLEASNVDVAEELIQLILAQRAYELNSKVIQAADESMSVAANLRR